MTGEIRAIRGHGARAPRRGLQPRALDGPGRRGRRGRRPGGVPAGVPVFRRPARPERQGVVHGGRPQRLSRLAASTAAPRAARRAYDEEAHGAPRAAPAAANESPKPRASARPTRAGCTSASRALPVEYREVHGAARAGGDVVQGDQRDRRGTDRHRDVAARARLATCCSAACRARGLRRRLVNCARLRQVLDAYLDGELDRATAAEIDRASRRLSRVHVCAAERDCAGAGASGRRRPCYRAPAALRSAVSEHASESGRAIRAGLCVAASRGWRASLLAAAAALAGIAVGLWLARLPVDDPMREQVVASHVASLAPDAAAHRRRFGRSARAQAVVRGQDRFRAGGARSVGGRVRAARRAARPRCATARRRRSSTASAITTSTCSSGARPSIAREPVEVSAVRGFGVATWADGGVGFAAVSDVDRRDLERFAALATAIR